MNLSYLYIPLIFAIGYLFGKWTCGRKTVAGGLVTTTVIFILLNLIHSIIDGAILNSLKLSVYSISMIGGHEIIRQPLMYFFYFTSTAPFSRPLWYKILLAIFSVTGIWVIGIVVGSHIMIPGENFPDYKLALFTYVFFGGDMVHHFFDYIKLRRKFRAKNNTL